MHRQTIYVVCAEGEEELAETLLAQPLRAAGYDVAHTGTVVVGESLVGEAAKALAAGSPIVLCATIRAAGSQWAHHIVNAGHAGGPVRVFVVKMDKQAYVEHLALKSRVANYCDNSDKALRDLLDALAKHFPPTSGAKTPSKDGITIADCQFLDQLTEAVTFDIEALQIFRSELRKEVAARYPDALSAWEFLDRAGLRVDGRLTRTGALLFGKNPTVACPMTMVKCARYYGTDRAAERDIVTYEETVPAQIVAARDFVADHVRRGEAPSADQAQSTAVYDYPMIAVREIIANALVHRDYTSADACVHVRIFADRLEVSSPGTWLGRDLLIGNEYHLADLEGQSIKRNSRLAHILSWIRIVEGEGSGIPSALQDCEEMQSAPPTVVQEQGFVTVTLRQRMLDHEALSMPGAVAEFCAALRRLQQDSGFSRAELARRIDGGRSRLYAILEGQVHRPPEWDQLVEPLVRACAHNDESEVRYWRRRHGELVRRYDEVRRRERRGGTLTPAVLARVVPAQLPADADVFTGRAAELAELDRVLASVADEAPGTAGGPPAVVISAVSGTAGVGKTALALRWAHRVRGEFPDGQLYVNLRGYDPDQPMAAGDALAGFLRALGVAGQDIPVELAERAAAYRSLLDGQRMLVVLDNAGSVEQIRPLLPGTRSCLVVVTSRDSLAGLVARHGARRLELDLLPPDDAVALLGALIGGRVEADPDAAWRLAEQCARLPLALRVAAEFAATRTATSLNTLVEELTDEQRRLELFDAGDDPRTAVRAVFSWSYQNLTTEAARVFRFLGLHPGPHLTLYATAALAAASVERAQQLLDLLARVHLIQPVSPGRFGMHDLLRAYALGLATYEDPEGERRAALTRLFDHYLATCADAMNALVPAEKHHRPSTPPSATPSPALAEPTIARAWLDTERSTLTAICAYAASHGWPGHTTRLAITLFRYLDICGHYSDALTIHTHALDVARRTGDRVAEAHTLTNLGIVDWRQDRYQQAAAHLQQALVLCREIGDRNGEIRALGNLGTVYSRQSRFQQAAEHLQKTLTLSAEIGDRNGEAVGLASLGIVYRRRGRYEQASDHLQYALALFRETGDRAGEAHALTNLGGIYWLRGHHQQAAEHHLQAAEMCREIGDRAGEADALTNLGLVYSRQGHYQQAVEHHHRALALFREIGDRAGEADALTNLGLVYSRQGHYQQAVEHHHQALALFREIGDRAGETETLNGLGETQQTTGQLREARIQHTTALNLAAVLGDRYEEARAHNGLARIHQATDDPDQARHHWRRALDLYADLGVPEANDVRAHLTTLDEADRA